MKLIFVFCFLIVFSSCNNKKKENIKAETAESERVLTTQEKIAYKNGFEEWDSVSEIKFTFNVDRGESHYERSWLWEPKNDKVVMIQKEDSIQYNRKQMDSITLKTDASFINDSYWLLAPYKLVWDKGTTSKEMTDVIAPMSKDTLNKLTVLYGNEGGYTPGDAYDFYYDEDFRIKEWIFRKSNSEIPTMMTTWEDYKNHNGLLLAEKHTDSTGAFSLYFTNIEVTK